jgi:hypothetical protein
MVKLPYQGVARVGAKQLRQFAKKRWQMTTPASPQMAQVQVSPPILQQTSVVKLSEPPILSVQQTSVVKLLPSEVVPTGAKQLCKLDGGSLHMTTPASSQVSPAQVSTTGFSR